MRITFDQNKFILETPSTIAAPSQGAWIKEAPGKYWTKDIRAAALFKKYADSKARNVFDKLMLQNVALPKGGVPTPRGLTLYPFQALRGVPHILSRNRSYLAHQPGLGKSAQAVAAINLKPGKALFVVPAFLKTTWAREITKWAVSDFPRIQVVPSTQHQDKMDWAADYIIVSDAMLATPWVAARLSELKFKYVFIDEGHRFKEPSSKRSVALFGGRVGALVSRGLIYGPEHVCVLSGTPLLNRPIELWPVLFAMAPELIDFMSYEDFGFKFGGATQDDRGRWRFIGSANEAELHKRIMGRFMQRITKDDVLDDLPDKVRQVIVMDHDPRTPEHRAYDARLLAELRKSNFDRPTGLGDYATIRHENGMAKVKWAAEFISEILTADDNESVIVFAHHREVVSTLANALKKFSPMVVNGATRMDERTQYQDAFQSKKRRLIIGNIDAMNLGLTLTAGTRSVFVEYAWTPSANEQAEDRMHRIGQKDSVLCQYLVLPNSIDEAILNSILLKERAINKVMG